MKILTSIYCTFGIIFILYDLFTEKLTHNEKSKRRTIRILYVVLISVFLSVLGCTDNEVDFNKRDYIIENNTDFQLDIKFYNKTSGILIGNLSGIIQNRDSQLTNTIEQTSEFENINVPYVGADSVKVIIDNDKFFTSSYDFDNSIFSEPINRNLFRHSNYENLGNERYLFKIAQQDYENAEDCNGNCD